MSLDEWTSWKTGLLLVLVGVLGSLCVPQWNIAALSWRKGQWRLPVCKSTLKLALTTLKTQK